MERGGEGETHHHERREVYPLGFWGSVGHPDVSLQRCLVQVVFQPKLPQERIFEEAIQIMNKELENKTVREVI